MSSALASSTTASAMDTESDRPPLPANSGSTSNSKQGIDIRDALNILSARSSSQHEPHATSDESNDAACPCCQGNGSIPDSLKSMGQKLDLMAPSAVGPVPSTSEESTPLAEEDAKVEKERLQKERAERQAKIRSELQSMTSSELLQAVLKAQQDRVATYKEYDSALKTVLQTMNLTPYPEACSKATASFSVLSETIKTIQEILEQSNKKDLAAFIRDLQKYEQEKLQLTAAYHLEQIRHRNQQVAASTEQRGDRIGHLLNESVRSLQQKIQACVENINEVLDEIRCAILEE